jgi:3'(2'), 5'-bisphosphate nucleotidase
MMTATVADHRVAAEIATETGHLLVALRATLHQSGAESADVRAAGDRAAHEHIVAALAAARPDDAVLSEEGADDPARLTATRVWIVDPLDGTREFGEAGRTDWAVHIAFVVDGFPAAAAVALPARDLILGTQPPPIVATATGGPLKIAVSRTRPPALALDLARELEAELAPMGSAGVKTMAVLSGEADIYVHAGGQWEWDSAAPIGVAAAAGLHVSRIDGSPIRYNQPNPWLPDQLVCRPELAERVLAILKTLSS